jgi:AcrR family transcriptional regulator
MSMARQPFSENKVQQRRSDILETAMTLFERDGLDGVSLRKVAAAMGCSYTALYRYFPSKDSLITAMRAQAFRWMEAEMLKVIRASNRPMTQLQRLAEAFIRAGIRCPQRYALMFFRLPEPEDGPASLELKAAKRDALDVCTRTVAAADAAGELQLSVDPLTASHLFWAGAHGLVALDVAGQFVMGRSVDDLVAAMITTLLRGIESTEAASDTSAQDFGRTGSR